MGIIDNSRLIQEKSEIFTQIIDNYQDRNEEIVSNYAEQLEKFVKEFKQKSERLLDENRKLRIGIVGQIKVGKSSFLNSLLFESQDILPKAATPMTAALTIISYAEMSKAEVEFYTQEDWGEIEKRAQKYKEKIEQSREELKREQSNRSFGGAITQDQLETRANVSQEQKVANELCEMVKARGLSVDKYLGEKSKEISLSELDDYVGTDGRYTPLTKSSHLYINNEGIKNIEVVDTPGMNDPIISRGERTREHLGQCDVVFLLSYAGQFLDNSDIGVLHQNLPQEGIKDVVILGTKLDSVLMDVAYDYEGDLQRSLINVEHKLEEQARDTIIPLLNKDPDNEILQNLRKSLPPKFISAMTYDIAINYGGLNKDQEFILNRLENIFTYDFTPEILKELANIEIIKEEELSRIRKDKDEILADRLEGMLPGQEEKIKEILDNLKSDIKARIDDLKNTDLDELNKREQMIENSINQAENQIISAFHDATYNMKKNFSELKSEIHQLAREYKGIQVRTKTETKSRKVKKSGLLSWAARKIGIGGYRTESYTETHKYASVYDAVEKVKALVGDIENKIRLEIEKAINFFELRKSLIDAIKNNFDLTDENFDYKHIVKPVQRTIDNISIPEVYFNDSKYRGIITSEFNGAEVKGKDAIYKLQNLQGEAIAKVLSDIREEIAVQMDNMLAELNKAGDNFTEQVLAKSKLEIKEIREEIGDREEKLKRTLEKYNQILDLIEGDLKRI